MQTIREDLVFSAELLRLEAALEAASGRAGEAGTGETGAALAARSARQAIEQLAALGTGAAPPGAVER